MDILGALENLGFDWRVALASLVNFLIVFLLLKHFVFGPLKETLTRRREKIEEGIENAEIAKRDRVMAEEMYEKKLEEGNREVNKIISEAKTKERSILLSAQSQAREETRLIIEGAQEEIERKKEQAVREVRNETAELIVRSVEKILREEINEKKNEEIINRLITQ